MKKILIFALFLFLISNFAFSQSGWFWQNPLPQGNDLNKVSFINTFTGWAVGDNSTILKTTNGGLHWLLLECGGSKIYTNVTFINENTGYIGGGSYQSSYFIQKTTNSGLNWYTQIEGDSSDVQSLFFLNANTGWFVGQYMETKIFKTTNGGNNWFNLNSNGMSWLRCITFLNSNVGFAGGENSIYKTSNGGFTWELSASNIGTVYSIHFLDSNTGFATTIFGNSILKTTNAGITWVNVSSLNIDGLYDIKFYNQYIGIAIGASGLILRTSNSGINWNVINNWNTGWFKSLNLFDSSGIITGISGEILESTDYGLNWIRKDSSTLHDMTGIYFINSNTGFVTSTSSQGHILKTTNGGLNWNIIRQGNEFINCFSFINNSTGWAAGLGEKIIKTTDGGNSWLLLYENNSSCGFNDIKFLDNFTGIAIGGCSPYGTGLLKRTTNGGINWVIEYVDGQFGRSFHSLDFVNANTGWAVGTSTSELPGIIKRTTNAGLDWEEQNSNVFQFNYFVDFINENTGFVGGDGKLLRTTNGGTNWEVNNQGDIFLYVKMFSESVILCAGHSKTWISLNGGLNWTSQDYLQDGTRRKAFFTSQSNGWVIGYNGMILKTTTGGFPIGVIQSSNHIPNTFSLHQNYPNPFNPITKIKFDIPPVGQRHAFDTKLIIYDLLGREVTTLVNEQLKPGSYEVEWDGDGFASGVYFYSLITEKFVETKRMVLIK